MTIPVLSNNWFLGDRPDLGAMNALNRLIREFDIRSSRALPRLWRASDLIIASDYSGQHSTSQYEAYGFVALDAGRLDPWLHAREHFRRHHLTGSRRMSFKALNDRIRASALPGFLKMSDTMSGLLLVVLIDKRAGPLFDRDDDPPLTELEVRLKTEWPTSSTEKMFRICHFISLLLAGLSKQLQNVLWVTDQDDIAANTQRHRDLVEAFGRIMSHYVEHMLGHIRMATTASDSGSLDIEDLVATADLAAGAVCQVMNTYQTAGNGLVHGVGTFRPSDLSPKVVNLMNWFSDQRSSLKRLVVSIEPGSQASKLLFRHIDFLGSTALARD